ncbi:LrgB family protein [uncultured Gemmiger sp.]|uniref:LrgB family protein n=1 Tax=uncultured Gemmiger sp. TaxID=1623490 RepID=UPI0025ED11B9|nr:LrgB family protein [uncultured Gemmiger sp.]
MIEFLSASSLFAILLTFGAYEIGCVCQRKFKLPIFNPILVGAILAGVVLVLTRVPNDSYQQGCETFSWLLTPATICLAIPLHIQFRRLKRELPAILAGVVAGTLVSLVCVWGMARLFEMEAVLTSSLLPKSVTTAMGIAVSEMMGGEPAITTAAIIFTGILGSAFGPWLCKVLRLHHPAAQGAAFGTASHVVGTAKAAEISETAEAVGSLALVIAGILTAVLCPLFANLM